MLKILMSGGHLTPALAVIDQAQLDDLPISFIFLGRRFSQESTKQVSQEKTEVEKRGCLFIPTTAPKFHKTFWWKNAMELMKFPKALGIAWKTISEHKPDIFLSFGGYLAFPIAVVCRIRRIPVITHEQTTSRGLANQVIAMISDRVAVSHTSSMELFAPEKTVLTGNPIRPSMTNKNPARPEWLPAQIRKPILYITGGNQGSEILNMVVEQTLPTLTSQFFVIHQCGNPSQTSNYFLRLTQAKEKLTGAQQKNYTVKTWISEQELSWIYQKASVVVSRSGANTTQELIVHKVPSVLIPLPFSHNDEQQKNAEVIANAGGAIILLQKDLIPESFLSKITQVSNRHDKMEEAVAMLREQLILDGASRLLKLAEELANKNKPRKN